MAGEGRRGAADLVGGFLAWSFITSLDIAALFGSAEGQLIGTLIVSLLDAESREQRAAWWPRQEAYEIA